MQDDDQPAEEVVSSESSDDTDGDNDSDDDLPDGETLVERKKRDLSGAGIAWCGTDTENVSTSKLQWPPDPSTVGNPDWRNLRPVQQGNPLYGPRMQLYCRTHMHLAIYPDGTVRGTEDDEDFYTGVQLSGAGYPGHVRIQGIRSQLYCSMNRKGWLYGEADPSEEGTIFIQSFQGSYHTFLSRKFAHLGWYIGIKKSGKRKKAQKTAYGQKAIQFLPRRSKFE